ncbi:MAG: hypothetical protein QNJ77_03725 [Acidimicrobiia bacterium]|nr:hypothetical protein [Acidimicrobiia bacterium]
MPDDASAAGEVTPVKEFSIVRKGYAPDEVEERLAEYDVALRELEEYSARLKQELADARAEVRRLEEVEQEAVDRAMLAVFDSKKRILERARRKALKIENEARVAAGMEPLDEDEVDRDEADDDLLIGVVTSPAPAITGASFEDPAPAPAPRDETDGPADDAEPTDVLRQMLAEADAIRNQLEHGLTSAFEEIERMQRDAEARATALLDDARTEAARLEAAGDAAGRGDGGIHVTLSAEELDDQKERELRSRYSRNSAKLPRIGEPAGASVLASMNQLRNKLREAEKAALKVQDTAS